LLYDIAGFEVLSAVTMRCSNFLENNIWWVNASFLLSIIFNPEKGVICFSEMVDGFFQVTQHLISV
jgi:hypothetical protein